MWLSREISSFGKKESGLSMGKVNRVSRDVVSVESETDCRNLKIVCPYGIVSIPTISSDAVIAPFSSNFLYMGTTINNSYDLNPGELGLFSLGGASIVLKNDGRVLINGVAVGS